MNPIYTGPNEIDTDIIPPEAIAEAEADGLTIKLIAKDKKYKLEWRTNLPNCPLLHRLQGPASGGFYYYYGRMCIDKIHHHELNRSYKQVFYNECYHMLDEAGRPHSLTSQSLGANYFHGIKISIEVHRALRAIYAMDPDLYSDDVNLDDDTWWDIYSGIERIAVLSKDGILAHYKDDNIHRLDGPAIIGENGLKKWAVMGTIFDNESEWRKYLDNLLLASLRPTKPAPRKRSRSSVKKLKDPVAREENVSLMPAITAAAAITAIKSAVSHIQKTAAKEAIGAAVAKQCTTI